VSKFDVYISVMYASRNHKVIHVVHVLVIHTSPIFLDEKNFYDTAKPLLYDNVQDRT